MWTGINICSQIIGKYGIDRKNRKDCEQHSTRNYTIFTLCHYVTESKDTDSKGSITKQNIIGSSDTKQMNEQEKEDYYNQLVQKYMQGTLTAEEQKIFDEWK